MKLILNIVIILIITTTALISKTKGGVRLNISIPQISSGGGSYNSSPGFVPGLNLYLYNNPAYGNILLNQFNANMNAINSHIPQPQSDLGAQYLDKQIQKEILEDSSVQPIQPGQSLPTYRITNIIDHGRSDKSNDPKFKNVDYLLWKFQSIEEGNNVSIKGNHLEFGSSTVFADKPDSLLQFMNKEKENIFLLESRSNGVLIGLLINNRTKKATRIQCSKKDSSSEVYDFSIIGEEAEFWNYLSLFGKTKE